jgi:hypothetical protein
MEVLRLRDEGVLAIWEMKQQEYEVAWNERQKVIDTERQAGRPDVLPPLKLNDVPMWQRVTGLTADNEWRLRPSDRRGALMRLARTVERMVRAEWKRVLEPTEERADPFVDDERERQLAKCRFATRTAQWDPVSEICFYLEIAQTKLSELLRQGTGLRARELSDCVRGEKIRAHLKETMRKAASAWLQNEFMTTDYRGLVKLSAEEGRAIVLREYRASSEFLDRTELAQAFDLGSRARLYRAVRICEHMELEALERAVALEVFLEMLPGIWSGCEVSSDERAALKERVDGEVDGMKSD